MTVDELLGEAYPVVKEVKENLDAINEVADNLDDVTAAVASAAAAAASAALAASSEAQAAASATAAIMAKVGAEQAETNAETAETNAEAAQAAAEAAAAAAQLAEANAETAEVNAELAETNAETAEVAAETAAAAAAGSATTAAGQATTAANHKTAAELAEANAEAALAQALDALAAAEDARDAALVAQAAAEAAKAAAEAGFDSFDDKYLGSKTSNPTLDNDGNALIDGAIIWHSVAKEWRAYDLATTTWFAMSAGVAEASSIGFTPAGNLSSDNVQDALTELDTEKIPHTYLDTDTTLAANSDTKLATQKAVKAYVDDAVADVEAVIIVTDEFVGDGTADYTLSQAPLEEQTCWPVVGGVEQPPSTFSLSGSVITFSETIAVGVAIHVKYIGGAFAVDSETHATNAANSAAAAAASETAAELAETNAETAETNAEAAAAAAAASATAAQTAETNAETAETNAETAATAAAGSASSAATSATNAATSASAAATAETNAETAESNAETAQAAAEAAQAAAEGFRDNAEAAETAAEAARDLALTYRDAAEAFKNSAQTAETNAETAEANAETAETNAETAQAAAEDARDAALVAQAAAEAAQAAAEAGWDAFDDKYLGAKAANPTLDNDGNALQDGAVYWNNVALEWRVYDLGTTSWVPLAGGGAASGVATTPAGGLASTNVQDALNELDTEKFAKADVDTDNTLAADSDTKVASQKAIKAHVAAAIAALSSVYQAAATILTNIVGLSTNGLITRTASGVVAARSIVGTTNVVTVSNGDGVSDNPTIDIPTNAIGNTRLADMAESTIKGRAASAGTGDPTDLTAAQVKTLLAIAASDVVSGQFADARMPSRLGVSAEQTTDPNNIVTTGFYAGANTASNIPVAAHFYLWHIRWDVNSMYQEFQVYNTDERWTRKMTGATWGSWARALTNGYTVSTSDASGSAPDGTIWFKVP
jgi:hypothetical protein